MALKVFRSEITKDLDPDWGDTSPPATVEGYVVTVTVTQEVGSFKDHRFNMLIPECETDEYAQSIITTALELFLEDGDEYSVRGLTEEDVDNRIEENTPILSFNPNTQTNSLIDFFWLVPPKQQMN